MAKHSIFLLGILLLFSDCFADTFINQRSGEKFHGYAIKKKKGNRTQVRTENRAPQYLNLSDYEIRYNHLGRKNKVIIFEIKNSVNLISEVDAFEKAITAAANQGPLLILIEIDTPGGRIDLAQRICAAIIKTNNCRTIAFVSGDKFGGAFSAGAIIALACDNIYMRNATAIGAAAVYLQTAVGPKGLEDVYGKEISEKLNSAWSAYCSAIAERNNRPATLVKAMADKNIEVLEVIEDDKHLFIESKDKGTKQSIVRTWSSKGSLLTLTAEQAVESGIADDLVTSREELFTDLKAAKAAHVRDTKVSAARKKFERIRRKIEKSLSAINRLEGRAAALSDEIMAVNRRITIISGYGYQDNYERLQMPNRFFYSGVDLDELDAALAEYEALSQQLLMVLRNAISNYQRAIAIAQKHPDLHKTANSLAEGSESARTRYNRTRSQLRLFYNM